MSLRKNLDASDTEGALRNPRCEEKCAGRHAVSPERLSRVASPFLLDAIQLSRRNAAVPPDRISDSIALPTCIVPVPPSKGKEKPFLPLGVLARP